MNRNPTNPSPAYFAAAERGDLDGCACQGAGCSACDDGIAEWEEDRTAEREEMDRREDEREIAAAPCTCTWAMRRADDWCDACEARHQHERQRFVESDALTSP